MKGLCVARLAFLFLCLSSVAPAALRAAEAVKPVSDRELAPVVRDMCSKKVVLLGEDGNHAGAQTIAVKARLVEMLVQQCGFRGVVFESQFYDMLDFQHSLDAGTATDAQLSSAIGALWSRYAVFRPFQTWLFDQASAKRVLVAGIDPQVGGVGAPYSPETLPKVLAEVLEGGDRTRCLEVISRHNRWTYDDAHPFDQAAFYTLQGCLRKVAAAPALQSGPASSPLSAMVSSYLAYLNSIDPRDADQGARDKGMYQNLEWVISQWPPDTRLVIWTATVHASKIPVDGVSRGAPPLGSYVRHAFGDRAYALGFSATGGTYGTIGGYGDTHDLGPPSPASLEAIAFASQADHSDVRFLSAGRLRQLGNVPGHALGYGKFRTLIWSDYLDGILVLRTEAAARASLAR
jgi:erythromycin esterase-like protein